MHLSIQDLLYEEGPGVFLLVSIILGGGASWLAGRAVARTWRPAWKVVMYALILSLAVRFIHFSLFDGTLLSLHYYLVDSAICMVTGLLSFRAARAAQMVTQYRWINETDGPMRWRRKHY